MKATNLIISGYLILCLSACKKDNKTVNLTVVGKWNIVSISTYGTSYAVQPGDYFNFTANGTLYVKEGKVLDTFTYTMRADTGIVLTPPAYMKALSEYCSITTFTANNLLFNGPYPITPGGLNDVGSSIKLSR